MLDFAIFSLEIDKIDFESIEFSKYFGYMILSRY